MSTLIFNDLRLLLGFKFMTGSRRAKWQVLVTRCCHVGGNAAYEMLVQIV